MGQCASSGNDNEVTTKTAEYKEEEKVDPLSDVEKFSFIAHPTQFNIY